MSDEASIAVTSISEKADRATGIAPVSSGQRTMVQPLGNNVLVRKVDQAKMSKGGIAVLNKNDVNLEVEVVAQGPGMIKEDGTHLTMPFTIGDRVLMCGETGAKVMSDGEELLVIDQSVVMAVMR